MTRADRAFLQHILGSLTTGLVFTAPLTITLFPGPLQRLVHGTRDLALTCATAVYELGTRLPPLGAVVLALTVVTLLFAVARLRRMLARTAAMLDANRVTRPPRGLRRAAQAVGLEGRVVCYEDARPAAYCAGLLLPRVWISRGAVERLRRDELEAVLWHETAHLRRRDPLRIVLVRVLAAALFAVPWVRALGERFEVAAELDADRVALAAQGTASPLAGALYKLGTPTPAELQLAVGSWSVSRARVEQLCGGPEAHLLPSPPRVALATSVLTLTLALALALGQAARANLLPAYLVEALAPGPLAADIHTCPMPNEGVLL